MYIQFTIRLKLQSFIISYQPLRTKSLSKSTTKDVALSIQQAFTHLTLICITHSTPTYTKNIRNRETKYIQTRR